MKHFFMMLLLFACATAPKPAQKRASLSPADIATLVKPSMAMIRTEGGLGTGFVIWQDGRVATALHVVLGAREVEVVLADGRTFKTTELLAADPAHDLAIIRVPARDLRALHLGDSAKVHVGDPVVALGHPLGLENTLTNGIVSALRQLDPQVTLLQISAAIAGGSSGGPVLNDRAEVIGIATQYAPEGQNLSFAMPVDYLKSLLLVEKPISLGELAAHVDAGLLQGCSGEELEPTVKALLEAISAGAPQYNQGDQEGCYRTYEAVALKLLEDVRKCVGVRDALIVGLGRANQAPTPADKAWAMRHAFDRILGVVKRALER